MFSDIGSLTILNCNAVFHKLLPVIMGMMFSIPQFHWSASFLIPYVSLVIWLRPSDLGITGNHLSTMALKMFPPPPSQIRRDLSVIEVFKTKWCDKQMEFSLFFQKSKNNGTKQE
ncbi:hypothetical protein VNO80_16989 [Phaseolus coccineus]|uniref:Uncharacterized protein n=1 Tax=Phaseolus coccineus TaxID=3886 RepID=A0AAN9R4H6_PHACN